ncbi:hypothetical protein F9L16_23855 [Agarivorans sp. B2Z047]|uniref:hypothetical protein n=1 Tax=Agarivorans sp. B2Z047 TaxID=2652721 RepID=UPI00128CC0E7|nr:hypothetical protein [Agarivorans sp. B2Z047]MPW31985.1 hypothetical protein [Agarivorans sp. B2Z047]UQN41956.1 hypothetical protein LQZ07_19590 [Agarivorans sp. B2Z047]
MLIFKQKYVFLGLAAIVLIIISSLSFSGENKVLQNKPVFKIELSAYGLGYQVDVNGAAAIREFTAANQTTVNLVVNQWMHPEQSEFKFVILPPERGGEFMPNAFIKVALLIEDEDNSEVRYRLPLLMFDSKQLKAETEMSESLAAGQYRLADDNQVVAGSGDITLEEISKTAETRYEGAMRYKRQVRIPNSLPLWAFFNSDTLPDYYEMNDEDYEAAIKDLFVEYKKVQDALAANDVDSIMPMYAERNREGDAAFYYEKGGLEKLLRDGMQNSIDDPDWTLDDRKPSGVGITLEDNHKLVSLKIGNDSNAIGFTNSNDSYKSYPMMFRRENGKGILTR